MMKTLGLIILSLPIIAWSQEIRIDRNNPLLPKLSVTLEEESLKNLKENFSPHEVSSYLSLTQVINGVLAPVPVGGKYSINGTSLVFIPYNTLGEGIDFEIKFLDDNKVNTLQYTTPPLEKTNDKAHRLRIEGIYPASKIIPKNILFFHVRFSEMMAENIHGYTFVKILDSSGIEIPKVWRQRSYWLDDQKILVLMVHPGRVKRGIAMSTPFKIGHTYTLVVTGSIKDIHGCTLDTLVKQNFMISKEDYEIPKILFDQFQLPALGSKSALHFSFSEGMDHSSIVDGVKIYDEAGRLVAGIINGGESDKTFNFTPSVFWLKGKYTVVFEKKVCDFANNRLNRPFEITKITDVEKDSISVTYNFEL